MHPWTKKLQQQRKRGCYRTLHPRTSAQTVTAAIDGKSLLSFCSNDYLGLSNDPRVIDALKRGAECYGVGSGSSAMITGYCATHEALEEALAGFLGYPAVRLFSTGYQANLGAITALMGKDDVIFQDKSNHASLIDGARLSRATLKRYPHLSLTTLEKQLHDDTHATRLIVSDGTFSMSGDYAPLPALTELAAQHQALLYIDDAHGIGCLGAHGRGCIDLFETQPDILVGTLGKAFGCAGAFVASNATLIDTITQFARTYMFTTALPPALAVAATESLRIIQSEPERRHRLHDNIACFKQACEAAEIRLGPSSSPIQIIPIGDHETSTNIAQQLEKKGVYVKAIRPPTVPENKALLRVTLSALHTEEQIKTLVVAMAEA